MRRSIHTAFNFSSPTQPVKGSLLVAHPELHSRHFKRAVVLLCEHNANGSIGFILNKQSTTNVTEAVPLLDDVDSLLYHGGPVDMNGAYILHRCGSISSSIHIKDDLYYGGELSDIASVYNTKQLAATGFRFFLGYSSWRTNQLQLELQRNQWVIYDAAADFILTTAADRMWKTCLLQMGSQYTVFTNWPTDPTLN